MNFSLDDYRRQFSTGRSQRLVRYPRASLASLGWTGEAADVLAEVGLPSFAAPHLAFFCDDERLPPPAGPAADAAWGTDPVASMAARACSPWQRWRQIGVAGEGWPLCLSPDEPGAILWLRWPPSAAGEDAATSDPARPAQDAGLSSWGRLNSSPGRLAESLWEYRKMVEQALAHGQQQGETDAWRRGRYPAELDQRLQERLQQLDPEAWQADGYWPRHFQVRAKGR